jgi:DNA-binding IclR family transcriptional regulator
MRRLIEGFEPQPTLDPVAPDREYEVRYVIAPVFGPDGRPAIVLRLYGIDAQLSGRALLELRDKLLAAADVVTQRLGGSRPR